MKCKGILGVIACIVGVISIAATVAVLVNRFFKVDEDDYGYIECEDCDCDEE